MTGWSVVRIWGVRALLLRIRARVLTDQQCHFYGNFAIPSAASYAKSGVQATPASRVPLDGVERIFLRCFCSSLQVLMVG